MISEERFVIQGNTVFYKGMLIDLLKIMQFIGYQGKGQRTNEQWKFQGLCPVLL